MTTTVEGKMTISEAARETGLSIYTLRYYERAGLLVPVERDDSGQRRYSKRDVEWIIICKKFRATGMPISRIRQYVELVREGRGNEAERLALLEAHGEKVRTQLEEMRRTLEMIDYKIGRYRERIADGNGDSSDLPW